MARQRSGRSTSNVLIAFLVIAATILCYRAFHVRYDQELHSAVEKKLGELFPQARIYVGYVSQSENGSLNVTDVYIAARDSKLKKPSFSAQRIVISGRLGISDWAQDAISIRQIDLYGVQFWVWPKAGGGWSVEDIMPQPQLDACPPKIVFHDAALHLQKTADEGAPTVALHNLSGKIEPWRPDDLLQIPEKVFFASIQGSGTGVVEQFEIRAKLSLDDGSGAATGSFAGFQLSKSLLDKLPTELSQHLTQAEGLECRASAEFTIHANPNEPIAFNLEGDLTSGRLRDQRLPYLLENLSGKFSCKNSGLQLRNILAESNGTTLELGADMKGLSLSSPMTIVATVRDLHLDQRLYESLPANLQNQWQKLRPAGKVSGDIWLQFDGQRWTPTLSVNCQGVSIQPWLFPYPLSDIEGLVTYQNAQFSGAELHGRAEGQEVSGRFSLTRSGLEWFGRLECKANGAVSIDEQLLSALTPRGNAITGAETFVRSLHPTGSIQIINAIFQRNSPEDIWHRSIDANVFNGSIKYDGFQYPIHEIRGHIVGQDGRWWLDQFEGRNDSGRIRCSGNWNSQPNGEVPFDLEFEASAVPIERELKMALPSQAQFVWNELQPMGAIDQVLVKLERLPGSPDVVTSVRVVEESRSNALAGQSLRLRPRAFPYELKEVDCEINYTPGLVIIEKASGVNGSSRLALRGTCSPVENNRWQARVEWLPQTRLLVENQLLLALPKSIRDSLIKIDFSGPMSLLGKSDFTFSDSGDGNVQTSWDCQVAIEDGQLGNGSYIGGLRGTIYVRGRNDGNRVNATGSIAMDALTILGIPVTRLTGPFALLGSNLYFGSRVFEVLPQARQEVTEMTANALSGQFTVSGHGKLGKLDNGKFYIDASLKSADLSLLLRDLGVTETSVQALCDAEIDFNGVPWNPQTYDGEGRIHLSEAYLYELPFMIRLMNVASVNTRNNSAFETADIAFQFDGDRIPLQIVCEGDMLRLKGKGETNLRRELQLDLYSYVGRGIPGDVLSPLLAESRFATFMQIEVGGTLDSPTMLRRPFPAIENTFQQIFPELAEQPTGGRALRWRR